MTFRAKESMQIYTNSYLENGWFGENVTETEMKLFTVIKTERGLGFNSTDTFATLQFSSF